MKLFGYQHMLKHLISTVIAGSILVFGSLAMASEGAIGGPKLDLLQKELLNPEEILSTPIELSIRGAVAGVSTDYYKQTIVDAINTSDIFPADNTSDNTKGSKPYSLEIRIISVDTPSAGSDMTVNMRVVWKFYRTIDETVLLKEIISSTYTGALFEGGFIGANRVRAAMEGASRDNIRVGLEMLAALDLEPEAVSNLEP